MTTLIEKIEHIIVPPCELSNIKKNITLKLNSKISSCSNEDGYIIDIVDIKWNTITNIISRISGNCIFKVEYTAQVLKPEPGHEYYAVVCEYCPVGFITEYNSIKILIPEQDYNVKIGDWIKVRVKYIRYEQNCFKCIGEL